MYSDYSDKIWQYFQHPKHVGYLAVSEGVTQAKVGSYHQGEIIHLFIKIDTESQLILDAKFKAYGSGPCIAVCSYALEQIIGQSIDEASALSAHELKYALDIPDSKIHCAMLVEDAIKLALHNYQQTRHKTTTLTFTT